MEELKKLLTEEKPLLEQVHMDIAALSALFIPFLIKMDSFMDNMQAFIDKKDGN